MSSFIRLNDYATSFSILTPKIGQGQHRHGLHYINFVEPESPMLHAKFQDHRTSSSIEEFLKVFIKYGHGGHLCHVTWSININFGPPSQICST